MSKKTISPEKYLDCLFQIGAGLATDYTDCGPSSEKIFSDYAIALTDRLLADSGFQVAPSEPLNVAEDL